MAVAKAKNNSPGRPRTRPAIRGARPGASRQNSPRTQELTAYRDMLLIRRFEEKAGQMYGMGLIGGFCHLYIGQEAVVTGVTMASAQGRGRADHRLSRPRPHAGHGLDPKGVMAELTGRQGGLSQGQGRLDAHVLQRAPLLWRQRHRRRAGVARHRAGLCRQIQGRRLRQPRPISATARPTRARSMRASTWPSSGSCRWSTSSRTTATAWAPRSSAPRRSRSLPSAAWASTSPASRSTAWMCA